MRKQIILVACAAMLAGSFATDALADMSASFDRSANVNGLQEKLSSSVSLGNFQSNVIGYNIYNRMADRQQNMLLSAVPGAPFPSQRDKHDYLAVLAALDMGHTQDLCHSQEADLTGEARAVYRVVRYSECYTLHAGTPAGMPAGDLDQLSVYGPVQSFNAASSAVGFWTAWAIFHHVFTVQDYAHQLDVLAPSMMFNTANSNASNRVVWQVQAYLNAYAYGAHGFTSGNMLPLVPLCEASQANACGITPSDFNPEESERELMQAVKAFSGKATEAAQVRIDREIQETRAELVHSGIRVVGTVAAAPSALQGTWKPDPAQLRMQALQVRARQQMQLSFDRDAACRAKLQLPQNPSLWSHQQILEHAQCVLGD